MVTVTEMEKSLRLMEFPFCVREALSKMEIVLEGRTTGLLDKQHLIAMADEFVFCDTGRRQRMNSIQELQMLELTSTYLAFLSQDYLRKGIFECLFPPHRPARIHVLTKLGSLALSTNNYPVLHCLGQWMKMEGCSDACICVCKEVLVDYLTLVPSSFEKVAQLSTSVPLLAVCFLTMLTQMYSQPGEISETLLLLSCKWLSMEPSPLASTSNDVNPLGGVASWCVISLECTLEPSIAKLFSQMHFYILQTLSNVTQFPPSSLPIPAMQLITIAKHLHQPSADTIDRLAQIVQVAHSTRNISGSKDLLLDTLTTLPETPLLNIVTTRLMYN